MSLKAFVSNAGHFYEMEGPYVSAVPLLNRSGVYLISTMRPDGTHQVIDVGESHDLHHRVSTHDRSPDWQPNIFDKLYVSVLYCDESMRMLVERQLRLFYNPPVGVR